MGTLAGREGREGCQVGAYLVKKLISHAASPSPAYGMHARTRVVTQDVAWDSHVTAQPGPPPPPAGVTVFLLRSVSPGPSAGRQISAHPTAMIPFSGLDHQRVPDSPRSPPRHRPGIPSGISVVRAKGLWDLRKYSRARAREESESTFQSYQCHVTSGNPISRICGIPLLEGARRDNFQDVDS